MSSPSYKRHRFPPEIVAYAVWLYYRFALSFRDVEELLASRGVVVSYEAVRLWCCKFGPAFVRKLRPHRKRLGRRWHVDKDVTAEMMGNYPAMDVFAENEAQYISYWKNWLNSH